ncbi:hypothetical protein ABEB36_013553 [Hypothenemus hampei]|uniref:A-kinase anchor protein 2 C-terminal domain-containing protein n=1 Tax=Hypothenemus hampei TaxID=57062 RepID=A0ABD1E7B6_HYPHA
MSISNLSTLDRIQLEIKETVQREKELKNGYKKNQSPTNNQPITTNGHTKINKMSLDSNPQVNSNSNGLRKFIQNSTSNTTKGVMHKFLKARGKLIMPSINTNNNNQNTWATDAIFQPAKIIIGSRPLRNGYITAEEKMKRELQDFRERETLLREERRKSQPDLMAALKLEEEEDENEFDNVRSNNINGLKTAKSMASLYSCSNLNNSNSDDGFEDNCSSTGGSLKQARSLAELCDLSDDEEALPGTHTLIRRFENMQFNNRPSSQSSSRDF